jgi:hypothetical protein
MITISNKKNFLIFIAIFLNFITFGNPNKILANLDFCLNLKIDSTQSDKDYCQGELDKIEVELVLLLEQQKQQSKNTGTIKGDINYLNSQIKALEAKIKARNLAIAQLKISIKEKVLKIEDLSGKIEKQHESIGQLLRNMNDFDSKNFVSLVLSDQDISYFYNDLESYASIKQAIKVSIDGIKENKKETEEVKENLEKKKDAETDTRVELQSSQEKVVKAESQKKKLLSLSQKKEKEYKGLVEQKRIQASKIKAALFPLRDTKAIPFGTALEYAELAEKSTKVRPALVLAILKQESNLGSNVGTCNRSKDPDSKKWYNIMHTRDRPSFERIVSSLGLNPYDVPLSCPERIGWGGAMGPSQFIPSTWELYSKEVAQAVGISGMPNPWDPLHAITATSVYLDKLGADKSGYTAERTAACRYYSGSGCRERHVTRYGNNVMALAKSIQKDIDLLRE